MRPASARGAVSRTSQLRQCWRALLERRRRRCGPSANPGNGCEKSNRSSLTITPGPHIFGLGGITKTMALDPSLYINREMSWLAFNARVLHEALDPRNRLLERVKFLSIFSTNLDEFYMV